MGPFATGVTRRGIITERVQRVPGVCGNRVPYTLPGFRLLPLL